MTHKHIDYKQYKGGYGGAEPPSEEPTAPKVDRGWSQKCIPHSPDLARGEDGWVEILINSIPHELVQVGYRVEMVQDPFTYSKYMAVSGSLVPCKR